MALGLGLWLGLSRQRKVSTFKPQTITLTGTPIYFRIGWKGMVPTTKQDLIDMGYVEFGGADTNAITISKRASYYEFGGLKAGHTVTLKKFDKLTYLNLYGDNVINWTYEGALPAGLTCLLLRSSFINWTYEGALPAGLTYLWLWGANVNWTYEGALPDRLTELRLNAANVNWTYEGALPDRLTTLELRGSFINWTYEGALPDRLTYLELYGANVNWTYFDVAGTGNILATFILTNFVTTPMTAAQLIQLFQSMAQRVGNLPATCDISDYGNNPTTTDITAAEPDEDGTDAEKIKFWLYEIMDKKSVTKITLRSVVYEPPTS